MDAWQAGWRCHGRRVGGDTGLAERELGIALTGGKLGLEGNTSGWSRWHTFKDRGALGA